MTKTLTIGFSPCPNDCFIFDALVNGKIDTGNLKFNAVLEDVETLNRAALKGELDITKLSFHTCAYVMDQYVLLRSGSALGFNCGPLLVSRPDHAGPIRSIAIPGKLTTANFLLSIAMPELSDKREYLFSDIEDAVLRRKVDAGLIIHENRFTYEAKGLKKVMDLGEYWDSMIHAPIPLGGIVARRALGPELLKEVNALIRRSLETAFANPAGAMPYVREHAQTMDEAVMKKHIDLYVNQFSLDLGETGTSAVTTMFNEAQRKGLFKAPKASIFI